MWTILLPACLLALPQSIMRPVVAAGRGGPTKLVVSAQLIIPDADGEEVTALEFEELPVPLARVLLNEEGSAVGTDASLPTEEDACALLGAAGLDGGEQLSLTLCDDAHIRELNNQWRSVDAPTDVLSFPMDDEQLLGDLVISLDTARRQAQERSHSLRDEVRVSN